VGMSEEKIIKMQQLVSFTLANEEFGVDIIKVQEIMRVQEITKVPQMPDYVEGVINLRGNVIPIIDLRKKFGLEVKERDNQTRIIVVNVQDRIVGFIVDAVQQVLRLSEDQIEPPPEVGTSINREYLNGVGKLDDRLLILLSLDTLLTMDDHNELEKAIMQ
jgi:purine-binding chemotaxis protein CheW